MTERPTGTVTFLFTDIEGSTKLWQQYPSAMPAALAHHHAILREAIEAHGGYVFQIIGDAFCAAFSTATDGLEAALAAQRALRDELWGETGPIRVRMALHTGTAEVRAGEFTSGEYLSGLTLSRAARLLSAGHGGQILLSLPAAELARDHLPPSVMLCDLDVHRLKDLIRPEHIYQVVTPDLRSDFLPLKTLNTHPNNLPIQLTNFVGREPEMARVQELLAGGRLLTLTGAGGSGKTRLALQVSADMIDEFPDGVWFVELASLTDPALIPQTVASLLGLREESGRSVMMMLSDYLRAKTTLLVLDNCEHLIDTCAEFADAILHAAPKIKILTTSREALGIGGETAYRVPSLSLPDAHHLPPPSALSQYEAVRLFIDRAVAVRSDFTVTNANAPAVAQICCRLDGIPLAIELAAARTRGMKVEQIAQRLNDRFRLLTGGSRTELPRHQTLRAMIDWSYSLLSDQERILFQRLSVFVGGWTIETAEAVCAGEGIEWHAILELLLDLVDKSLIGVDERSDETRYQMLETIREYAHEKLSESGEMDKLQRKHLDFFLSLAEQAEPKLQSEEQVLWLNRLEKEHHNLRAALKWSEAEGEESEAGLRLAGALWRFWEIRGYLAEGRTQLEAALARGGKAPMSARAKALVGTGSLAWHQTDYAAATAFHEQALAIQRELKDNKGIAFSLNNLGAQALERGDLQPAASRFEESLALSRALKDRRMAGYALHNLGEVARHQGDFSRAATLYNESLSLFRELKDTWAVSINLSWLGVAMQHLGNYEEAAAHLKESLTLCVELGVKRGIAECLEGLAGIACGRRHTTRAVQLFGAADVLRTAISSPLSPVDRTEHECILTGARAELGEKEFALAWIAGQAMTLEQAIEYALKDGNEPTS